MKAMQWSLVALFVLCALVYFTRLFSCNESYDAPMVRASDQTKTDLSGRVRLVGNSITRAVWANVTIKTKEKSGVERFGGIFNPKETLIFKGQPKYVTNHAIIVGKPFTFSVEEKSVAAAHLAVKRRAAEELEGINYVLRSNNLLAG